MDEQYHGALKNFVSIVPVFHPDKRGCEDTLVLAGTFTPDDVYGINQLFKKPFMHVMVDQGKKTINISSIRDDDTFFLLLDELQKLQQSIYVLDGLKQVGKRD